MEYKLKKDQVAVSEVVFDSFTELPVECDLLLPDYCPDIVKVLKCQAKPGFTKIEITGDKCFLEGTTAVSVYYSGEDGKLRTSEHKVEFFKTLELKNEPQSPLVFFTVKEDYLNCKAVNQRRVDVRGAFTVSVKILSQGWEEILSGAEGSGIQLNHKAAGISEIMGKAQKRFTLREEMELAEHMPAMDYLIRHEEKATVTDWQLTAGKVIVKGQLDVLLEYQPTEGTGPETATFILPVSQMMDIDDASDDCHCHVNLTLAGVTMHPQTDMDGLSRTISGEFSLRANCTVLREQTILPVVDAYSTQYELSLVHKQSAMLMNLPVLPQSIPVRESITLPEEFAQTTDFWCETGAMSTSIDSDVLTLGGKLKLCVFGKDEDNMPVYYEMVKDIDHTYPLPAKADGYCTDVNISTSGAGYMMGEKNTIECRCDLTVDGLILGILPVSAAVDINIDESRQKPKETQSAMTIYYADAGENIWNIAKRYNTSIAAVMEENGLEQEVLKQKQIVLIPLIS